jgi:hypothetical protein
VPHKAKERERTKRNFDKDWIHEEKARNSDLNTTRRKEERRDDSDDESKREAKRKQSK